MINPVISTTPPSAQRSDPSTTESAPTEAFGSVLARQIGEKSAAPATDTSKSKAAGDQANKSPTDSAQQNAAVTPDAASLAIAALSSKDIKFSTGKTVIVSTKNPHDPIVPAPDASSIPMIINPEIKVATGVGNDTHAGSNSVSSATASKSAVAISTKVDAGISAKVDAGISTKVDAGIIPKVDTGASDSKIVTTDALTLTQTATAKNGSTGLDMAIKSALEAKAAAVQPSSEQLASAQTLSVINSSSLSSNTTTIAAPLGSNAWSSEFSQKISWLSNQQSQVAELHLNPPDLGPMHVVISVTDNQATALFSSPHSEVRHAIENALPKLRESLADNGIMLGNATVSDQRPRDSGAGNFTHQRARDRVESLNTTESAPISTPLIATRRYTGILDTFA